MAAVLRRTIDVVSYVGNDLIRVVHRTDRRDARKTWPKAIDRKYEEPFYVVKKKHNFLM